MARVSKLTKEEKLKRDREYKQRWYANLSPEKKNEIRAKIAERRRQWLAIPENKKEYYSRYKDRKKEYCSKNSARMRKRLDEFKLSLGGCVDCGFNKWPEALDFDHVDPKTKEYNMAKLARFSAWDKFFAEAKKCQIRCANCHRHKHMYDKSHIDLTDMRTVVQCKDIPTLE